jgi:hypothetical protein
MNKKTLRSRNLKEVLEQLNIGRFNKIDFKWILKVFSSLIVHKI